MKTITSTLSFVSGAWIAAAVPVSEQQADLSGPCDAKSGVITPARDSGSTCEWSRVMWKRKAPREVAVADGTNAVLGLRNSACMMRNGNHEMFLYDTPPCDGRRRPNALR